MHGHQLRRDARVDRAELWSDVRPASLYGALHRLEDEGLVRALRTEQSGRLPSRTVYEVNDEGRHELGVLQAEASEEVRSPPDPVDLALAIATDLAETTMRGHLEDRVRDLTTRLARVDHLADRRWPDQTPADDLVVEHARLRLRAELDWHALVLDQLPKLGGDR